MPKLYANVDQWAYAEFVLRANQACVSKPDLLREIVYAFLATPREYPDVVPNGRTGNTVHKSVRLPDFLHDAACARAAAKGMSFSRWDASLIRSNLSRVPVLDDKEEQALRASNFELRMIGINLNQIAHALNISCDETDRIKLEVIEALVETINEHRQIELRLIQHSQDQWSADQ